jgi:hypothetical protein
VAQGEGPEFKPQYGKKKKKKKPQKAGVQKEMGCRKGGVKLK